MIIINIRISIHTHTHTDEDEEKLCKIIAWARFIIVGRNSLYLNHYN